MNKEFPIVNVKTIFNQYHKKGEINANQKLKQIEINYPCRLDAMAIDPSAVCYNSKMVFTPGEVVISLKKFINVKVKVVSNKGGKLSISNNTKRKSLVKHSYFLMCDALGICPSLEISVDDKDIPKHCGFGSSSSIIAAVAVAINEIYGNPIESDELIKYLASNHGEEVNEEDDDNLKVVQCIGGGATNGLTEEGIIIISGRATKIAKMFYEGQVLICIPRDFVQKDAKILMELEEKNLWKFKKTGDLYSKEIAYRLLHRAIPEMINGNIEQLADVVFDYRFNMGSNYNCSFVYDGLVEIGEQLRRLYEEKKCEMLALSSVGPAFFAIVNNEENKKSCKKYMEKLGLNVMEASICNSKYIVVNKEKEKCFWQDSKTNVIFQNRNVSKYITDLIDSFNLKERNCIDVGCGGGRYARYLMKKGANVLAIDKYEEMIGEYSKQINFIKSNMDKLPVKNKSYYVALSIGVIHNAESIEEYIRALKELYRIVEEDGKVILSIFTNDLITDDLENLGNNKYNVKGRSPMILLSKKEINYIVQNIGFKKINDVDEHVTDVGSGKRNVYTILLKK